MTEHSNGAEDSIAERVTRLEHALDAIGLWVGLRVRRESPSNATPSREFSIVMNDLRMRGGDQWLRWILLDDPSIADMAQRTGLDVPQVIKAMHEMAERGFALSMGPRGWITNPPM